MQAHFYSLTAKRTALAIGLLIFSSLLLRTYLSTIEFGSVSGAILNLSRFFTILTNFLVMLVMFRVGLAKQAPSTAIISAVVMSITGVGLVYHALLAHLWDPQGLHAVADQLVHTVAPALSLLWWLWYVNRNELSWKKPAVWIAWPLLYSVYALARSSQSGEYPYPFLDVAAHGLPQVLINIVGLGAAFFIIGSVMIFAARVFNPRK